MRLRPDKERMRLTRQFQNLQDRLRRMLAAENQAVLFEHRIVLRIDFKTMPEALADRRGFLV